MEVAWGTELSQSVSDVLPNKLWEMNDPHVSVISIMKYDKSQRNGRGGEVMGEMNMVNG